jgi:hypothetical protein
VTKPNWKWQGYSRQELEGAMSRMQSLAGDSLGDATLHQQLWIAHDAVKRIIDDEDILWHADNDDHNMNFDRY